MFSPARLYDLSLSIGESLELRKNCERFLSELVSTADLTTASVWLRHRTLTGEGSAFGEEAESTAVLVVGSPEGWFETKKISLDHPIFELLREHQNISIGADEERFHDIKIERKIHKGVVGVLALSGLGFLYLYSSDRRGAFSSAELRELSRVVSKFTVSIEACLAHNRVMREVALRKRIEIDLQHREEHFRALIENTVDIILVLDYDATIVFAGPSVERALGHRPSELEGTSFFEWVDPEEVTGHFQRFLAHVKNPGEAPPVEMRVRHGDGTWRVLSVASNNLLSTPSVAGIIMNCHDVTERRLWLAQVEAARKRAVEASRAKSEFVANVSHEIRNPLNGVIGMASMLLESDLTLEQRDCANTIRVSADTLLSIIEDILDLSKIESGKLTVEDEVFSLAESIEGCMDMVAPSAAEKGLEMAYLIHDPVVDQLSGAVVRVRQVLLNLLSNAVKFTESGEVFVSVTVAPVSSEDQYSGPVEIEVSVRDTGIGIEPDGKERLFQPFVQADASTTRLYGGSGLGLAISRRLCELMGGRIWFESEPGRGSTFNFTFQAATVGEIDGDAPPPKPLSGIRVIGVHRNQMMREVLTQYADRLGVEMVTVSSIAEAIEQVAQSENVDALIVDGAAFGTADRLGFDALRSLEAKMPVIAMRWAVSSNGPRPASRTRGFVLNKPIKPSQLHSVLVKALGLGGGGIEAVEETSTEGRDLRPLPRRLKLLLAEDDEIGRKVAVMMLESMGCHPQVVVNGLKAVEAVKAGDFDVVLMDLQMPGLDGLEATRQIRAMSLADQPIIIAMTARATSDDRELCYAAGMDGYLTKPIRKDDLRQSLLEAVPPTDSDSFQLNHVVVDSERLAVLLRTGGRELVAELIDLYVGEMPGRLEVLRSAIDKRDPEALRSMAHKIKGSSSNLGLPEVALASESIENIGREGDLEQADHLVGVLDSAYQRARIGLGGLADGWARRERK